MKTTISNVKSTLDGIHRRVDIVEGKNSELEDIQQNYREKKELERKPMSYVAHLKVA